MERSALRFVRRNVPCTMPLPCLQGRSAPIGRVVFATARKKMNKRQNEEAVDGAPQTRRRVALVGWPWRHARRRSMSAFSLCASPRSTRQPHLQRQNIHCRMCFSFIHQHHVAHTLPPPSYQWQQSSVCCAGKLERLPALAVDVGAFVASDHWVPLARGSISVQRSVC